MAKNIVIFSDGTGQRGGAAFDERRSNIYKLFRATRCGPDSSVDPNLQITYYDPGLGTVPEGTNMFAATYRQIHNIVSQATGLGLTENIVDCYEEIIRQWEPGDRVYLFGFSRGAYTVRCVAAVLCFCGVPTKMQDGSPLRRDAKTLRTLAREAVTQVYQHVSSPRDTQYLGQRAALAKRFRATYGSGTADDSNAYPYFIGVFDTVASIASLPALAIVVVGVAVLLSTLSAVLAMYSLTFFAWIAVLGLSSLALALGWYVVNHLKFARRLDGYTFWQTLHFTAPRMRFYDNLLNRNVGYARHALAIDEHRAAFDRVKWGNPKEDWPLREGGKQLWFRQLWFAGNHSDIGGSYPENESRLSDIALQWMVEEAQKIEHPLLTDSTVLRLFPSATGMQHDETKGGVFKFSGKINRSLVSDATLHPTVLERAKATHVLHHDELRAYRPHALREHTMLASLYSADDSEVT